MVQTNSVFKNRPPPPKPLSTFTNKNMKIENLEGSFFCGQRYIHGAKDNICGPRYIRGAKDNIAKTRMVHTIKIDIKKEN